MNYLRESFAELSGKSLGNNLSCIQLEPRHTALIQVVLPCSGKDDNAGWAFHRNQMIVPVDEMLPSQTTCKCRIIPLICTRVFCSHLFPPLNGGGAWNLKKYCKNWIGIRTANKYWKTLRCESLVFSMWIYLFNVFVPEIGSIHTYILLNIYAVETWVFPATLYTSTGAPPQASRVLPARLLLFRKILFTDCPPHKWKTNTTLELIFVVLNLLVFHLNGSAPINPPITVLSSCF